MVEVAMSNQYEVCIVRHCSLDVCRYCWPIKPSVDIDVSNALRISVVAERNLEACVP